MIGTIFDIQHFSVHDGPGIRTTVFLKGCNLRCAWCHNPESQNAKTELMIRRSSCIGCGACILQCGRKARILSGEELIYMRERCTECGKCVQVCYTDTLKMTGRELSAEQVVDEVTKDIHLYQNSGGGVTFSGGEAMLQLDFLEEVLSRCKALGIHTAVDTAGDVPWEHFQRILPYTDLFLYDLKCMDPETHRKFTGKENDRILANLEKLKFAGNIWIRIPCLQGVNDSEEEIRRYGSFLENPGNIRRVELLPYHSYGENKYQMLDRTVPSFRPMDRHAAAELQKRLEESGLQVYNFVSTEHTV